MNEYKYHPEIRVSGSGQGGHVPLEMRVLLQQITLSVCR